MIPVSKPILDGNESKYLIDCISSGWISSSGKYVTQFEEDMATWVGRKYSIAVCNGSCAIELAVAALNIGKGDEVILPTFSIISCVAPIIRAGGKPIFVDSDPETWNMNHLQIKDLITSRTKAIMLVHIYGLTTDIESIVEIARDNNIFLIEDAAEAHGLEYKNKLCGSFGDISIFSFYANKHITSGEGGMLLTNDSLLCRRLKKLRNLYFGDNERFRHEYLAWNYRMTNLQGAVGLAQLETIEQKLAIKRSIAHRYNLNFSGYNCIQLPLERTEHSENSYWIYGIVLDRRIKLAGFDMRSMLKKNGIDSRSFFYPLHLQPALANYNLTEDSDTFPVAENLSYNGFYIPSGPNITIDEIDQVSEVVINIIKEYE